MRITIESKAKLPTKYWDFDIAVTSNSIDKKEHIIISKWDINPNDDVIVRLHSECITGDLFGSLRCDCWDQLQSSMDMINKKWKWIILYLRQEWRWIWLANKLKAYNLQDQWMDTVEANQHLWFKADERWFDIAVAILKKLWINKIRLISNNPQKKDFLTKSWIEILELIPSKAKRTKHNEKYLDTKIKKMGHSFIL